MTSGFCGVVFRVFVKATACEVSSPMMPARMCWALAWEENSTKALTAGSRKRIMGGNYARRSAAFRVPEIHFAPMQYTALSLRRKSRSPLTAGVPWK